MVSDNTQLGVVERDCVSIRFEVRGGFRQARQRYVEVKEALEPFQSALRFAVVSDHPVRVSKVSL